LARRLVGARLVVAFDDDSVFETGACAHEGNQVGSVDGAPAGLGGFDQLNAIAIPAALEPGPLVTFVRWRTVAKVDSIGLVVRKWIQCSAG
jgi:hypothetical protein